MAKIGRTKSQDKFGAGVSASNAANGKTLSRGDWIIECYDRDGELKWTDEFKNEVVRSGLNYNIGVSLATTAQINTWYVGLMMTGSISVASGD